MTQARDLGDAANKANFLDNVTADINTFAPAGMIIPFGGTTAPSGYLACGGQLVSRATYASLFAAIGTAWNTGGENSAAFRLPDLRGAFLRGTGNSSVANMANGNDFAGPAVGSFEADQMQDHKHHLLYNNGAANTTFVNNYLGNQTNSSQLFGHGSITNSNTVIIDGPATIGSTGTPRTGDETRPFNAGILYCIKT